MKREFENVLKNLKETINNYDYYVDFDKVYKNANEHKKNLVLLNSLNGSKNIENDFLKILITNPSIVSIIPILLAIRDNDISILDKKIIKYRFKEKEMSDNEYLDFMRKTQLFEMLENSRITNLIDYIIGIEVGLDTNARKNRTGALMKNKVEDYIKKLKLTYYKQVSTKKIESEFNINLNALTEKNNYEKISEEKRIVINTTFDFVIKTEQNLYLIKTNFYNDSGSTPTKNAQNSQLLENNISRYYPNTSFIWITDGKGWQKAQKILEEAYNNIIHLYTLYDLEQDVLTDVIK